jgi:hypothetical protein
MLLCQTFEIYERILANRLIKEIKGRLEEELYIFRAGRATTAINDTKMILVGQNAKIERS